MSDYDVVKRILLADPQAVVVQQLDEWSHIESVYIWSVDTKIADTTVAVVEKLVSDGVLLPASRLTPERTYVHAQP